MINIKCDNCVDKFESLKKAIFQIKSTCDLKSDDKLQVVIPYLRHASQEERKRAAIYDPTIEVLEDFPHVEGLDTSDSFQVNKYIYIVIILDICYITVVEIWVIVS